MKIERRNPGMFQFVDEEFGTEVEREITRDELLDHVMHALRMLRPDRKERGKIVHALCTPTVLAGAE